MFMWQVDNSMQPIIIFAIPTAGLQVEKWNLIVYLKEKREEVGQYIEMGFPPALFCFTD